MALRRRITNALRATNTARKEAKQPPADPHQLFLRAHTERQRALEEARRALADLAMHERRAHLMAGTKRRVIRWRGSRRRGRRRP